MEMEVSISHQSLDYYLHRKKDVQLDFNGNLDHDQDPRIFKRFPIVIQPGGLNSLSAFSFHSVW